MPAMRGLRRLLMLSLLFALAGCAGLSPPMSVAELRDRPAVELTDVPFYPQERYQCGPAALATVLDWSGVGIGPQALTDKLYIPARQGSLQPELIAQARQYGRLVYQIPPKPEALLDELEAGHPVLVLQNLALSWYPKWHYAVVIGYEPDSGKVIMRSATTRRHTVALSTFLRTWARGDYWGLVTLRPGEMPGSGEPGRYLAAAFDLERAGFRQQAVDAYLAGLQHWPSHPGLRLALANRYYTDGRLTDAAATLEQGVAAGAADGTIYNNLSLMLAELGRWDEAEAAARQAVQSGGPRLAQYQDTLTEVCRRRPGGCRS
jgi:tetratricopeptide (TPR) repeat protein